MPYEDVVQSMELYAEHVGEPTSDIYARFYAIHPDAKEIFAGDAHLERRMMGDVLEILVDIAEGKLDAEIAHYWVADHVALEVTGTMAVDMLDAVVATFREGLAERWTSATEESWRALLGVYEPIVEGKFTEIEEM